jgi:hypothetical protein
LGEVEGGLNESVVVVETNLAGHAAGRIFWRIGGLFGGAYSVLEKDETQ